MSAYSALEARFRKRSILGGASAMLGWDNAVIMPDGGAEERAEQLAVLGVMGHEMMVDPAIADFLDAAETEELDAWQQANVAEMRRQWRHATALDADLVEALSKATSRCEMIWRRARADNDFAALGPSLEEVISLTRQGGQAKAAAFGTSCYAALLDEYEPGCTEAEIDRLFRDLEAFLPPFLSAVLEKQAAGPGFSRPGGPFAEDTQKAVGLDLMKALGFDFNRGRLDTSHHPFTGGIPDDVRLTTRYEADDFTQSLMGTLHETGHALYEQNLPRQWRHQPVGAARGMALHESQSLLVEMQLSRSPAFLSYVIPKLQKAFGGTGPDWEFENLMRLYHHVEPGFIRVDADEVTYPLHVILRYRLEKALLSGDLPLGELPGAWNDGMKELLGVTPPDDRLGCLQDIHWPGGAIGYFPTYTMGALAAAQFYNAAEQAIGTLPEQVERGEFTALTDWLRTKVHEVGSSRSTNQILEAATGQPLGTEAFKAHLKRRYLTE
ncbi:carboxypeptidase M32 [Sneathiella chinensis]|uniref:Metal-dependent carboxypeptidase n=1 Tax=Sneathiella chinensis TaxID=349750 RepID=A0ABQ5U356_9PROT|nr:carboxypeptidase M32 [Sneathiella chinensis]GLQ05673.1 carboxypeptidase M32 [Sneathiella chinensis]